MNNLHSGEVFILRVNNLYLTNLNLHLTNLSPKISRSLSPKISTKINILGGYNWA